MSRDWSRVGGWTGSRPFFLGFWATHGELLLPIMIMATAHTLDIGRTGRTGFSSVAGEVGRSGRVAVRFWFVFFTFVDL